MEMPDDNWDWVVQELDACPYDDPAYAHNYAETLLFLTVPEQVTAAYGKLAERSGWKPYAF